ncbi:MAG: hypothetical protein EOO05_22350 [Chitinophagaceae bacterium]|nr:MAG: hypothetical protein EOO05_22350 [Chitinophagaceae bacterium]
MKNIFNKALAVALVAIFTVSFSTKALAIDETNTSGVELKFIGNLKNQPIFQLTANHPEETEYTVSVIDENNVVLYKDNVKSGVAGKKFMLNTEELGDASVRFEITGKKSNKTIVYEVNRNSHVVSDLVINKVK